MIAIRHHVFVFVGLLLIGVLSGFWAAVWVGVGLALSIGANNLANSDKNGESTRSTRLILFVTVLSLLLALASAVVIFLRQGWIPALGFVLLFLGYFSLREDRYAKWKRMVEAARASLVESLTKQSSGQLTQEQVEERFSLTLRQDLPEEGYRLDFYVKVLLEQRDLTSTQYLAYLTLLEKHLSNVERRMLFSALHREVRTRLGLPPNG